ncbi:PepSY domain-containing protein [Melioribacter sp. Ez-97]|uniref:PepSY domain-containing protein n=1 Tax=Melioribacter sp. Ez-97 TaxID=3423434 RepID=UPI003ED868F6
MELLNSNKLRKNLYKWHNWIGALLALPIFITSITAIALPFRDELGFEEIFFSKNLFPGYFIENSTTKKINPLSDIKSFYQAGRINYYGTKYGLFFTTEENKTPSPVITNTEIRFIKAIDSDIFAGGKEGLWINTNNVWSKIYNGDVFDAGRFSNGKFYVALGKKGIDTIELTSSFAYAAEFKTADENYIALKELILHLHSGRAFFGKELEWIWITINGFSVTVLVFTGFYLWYKKKIKKSRKNKVAV